ncbi:MAG: hypothetical protein KDG51_03445 [Calditrichaeota bacterium]|nr:hypothetical protein [Calditrichota bacterium]
MGLPVFGMVNFPKGKPPPSLAEYIQQQKKELKLYADFFGDFFKPRRYQSRMLAGLYNYVREHYNSYLSIWRIDEQNSRILQNPELQEPWKRLGKNLESLYKYLGKVDERRYNPAEISLRIDRILNLHRKILWLLQNIPGI